MKRRLAAILAADVVGSARLMGADEENALNRIRDLQRDIVAPAVTFQEGRVVKYIGDGVLAEFPSVVNAVQAATEILGQNSEREAGQPEERRLRLRIGVNLGDIIGEDDDIYGDGVNVAARLEALADPDGLCISGIAYQALGTARAQSFADSGSYEVKNIEKPVRVYRWRATGTAGGGPPAPVRPTLAIAPFSAPGGRQAAADLAEELAEDIAVAIGTVSQLTVVDEDKSVETPRYRLSGSVRTSGNRYRVQAKLVDQFSGVQIWAQRFDRLADDLFELQDDLTQTIVIDVHTTLGAGSYTNRWQQGTHNFEAWRLSAHAFNQFQKYSPDAMERCIGIWNEALALDPEFPTPRIARSYCRSRIALWSPDRAAEMIAAAEEDFAIVRATTEENDARPFSLLRAIRIAQGDHDGALEAARQGLALEPGNPACWATLGYALMMAGRNEEALSEMHRAVREIPNYPGWFANILILAHLFGGDTEAARTEAEDVVARQPEFYFGRPLLAVCQTEMGSAEAAASTARDVWARDSKFSVETVVASFGLKHADSRERLRTALRQAGL